MNENKNMLDLIHSGEKNNFNGIVSHKSSSKIPFSGFLQNKGQLFQEEIKYYFSSSSLSVAFLNSKIRFTVNDSSNKLSTLNLTFVGSNDSEPQGMVKSLSMTNFFINGLSIANVPNYQEILYANLYPNIDLMYYFTNQGLKYEFIVKPGGNPDNIIIHSNKDIQIDTTGTKVSYFNPFSSKTTLLTDDNLLVYQGLESNQIKSSYSLTGNSLNNYKINIDPLTYNHSENLIIDPIWVEFSTYFGGSGTDIARAVATDSVGNNYIVGYTNSPESSFPLKNAYDSTLSTGGTNDAFIAKLNATGNGLVYSTYIGGSGEDRAYGIKVDSSGNAYVTGYTQSTQSTFPLVNAFNNTNSGGNDIFVLKLNATGNGIDFSTFIGGTKDDYGWSIAIDDLGNSYVTGYTTSNVSFPLKHSYNTTFGGGTDIFVLKLNATGNGLVFSTYLGGVNNDYGDAIDIDNQYSIYVAGSTSSNQSSFSLVNSFDNTYGGGIADGFALKLNSTGNGLVYSTYLGGSDLDEAWAIKVDNSRNAVVTGETGSTNFPTLKGYDSSHNGVAGVYNAFITKINSSGTGLVFSTYFGGTSSTDAYGLGLDSNDNIFITGPTQSTESSFPLLHASDSTFNGGTFDIYIAKFNSTGNGLLYSSFIGGSSDEYVYGLAVDNKDNPVITGYTKSTDFETTNAFDSSSNYIPKVFVSKFSNSSDDTDPVITLNNPINTTYYGKSITLTYSITESHPSTLKIYTDGVVNTSALPSGSVIPFLSNGSHTISLTATDQAGNTASYQVWFTLNDALTLSILNKKDYINSSEIFFSYSLANKTPYTSSVYVDSVINTSIANNSYIHLSDGPHNITLVGIDFSSNIFSDQWIFTVDTSNPTIIISNPSNNRYYASTQLILDYQVSDTNLLSTAIILDSSTNTSSEQPGFTLTGLSEGQHNLTIFAKDKADNLAILQILFYVDTINPSITINNPNTNNFTYNSILLDYNISDANLLNASIYIDGTKNSSNILSGSYINLVDGYHNITIEAFDKAGNSMIATKEFTIDSTPPIITITSPFFTTYNSTNIIFNYSVTDNNSYSVVIFIDNQTNQSSVLSGTTLQLQKGYHNITIFAIDTFGNSATQTVSFTVTIPSNTTSTATSSSINNKSTDIGSTIKGTTTVDFPFFILVISTVIVSRLRKGRKN